MKEIDSKKIKDLSEEGPQTTTQKLYQKVINMLLDIIFNVINKKKLRHLNYFIVKKDHIFLYEDSKNSYAFNPNGWGK